ncbi:MAG: TRAP transporter small permease [Gammaproteobacteria bacterium]
MTLFIKLVATLSRLCGIASAAMIVSAVLVVCQMVTLRYLFDQSTSWQSEFVTYVLIAATFVGSPYVLLTRGHVNVDLLPMYLGHRARIVLALLASTIALIFCLLITWYGFSLWHEAWSKDWHSDTIWGVRLWIPYAAMPIGFAVLSLQYIADMLSLITGRELPFGLAPETRIQDR